MGMGIQGNWGWGLHDAQAGHILAIDHAEGAVLGVGDDKVVDGGLFKDGEGIDGEGTGGDGLGGRRHEFADLPLEDIGVMEGGAAEVAIGEDAGELAGVGVGEGDGAAAGAGDGEEGVLDGKGIGCGSEAIAGAHDIIDAEEEGFSEGAGGVVAGEVVAGEAAELEKDHGEGVAEGEGGGGGSGGGEVEGTGFFFVVVEERMIGEPGEGGIGAGGEGYGGEAKAFEGGEEAKEVLGFAAVADEESEVALAAQAEVAVQGLIGIEERGGDGGGIKGATELGTDGNIFADPGEDQFAIAGAGLVDQVDGTDKPVIEAEGGPGEGVLFDLEALACGGEDGGGGTFHNKNRPCGGCSWARRSFG